MGAKRMAQNPEVLGIVLGAIGAGVLAVFVGVVR
jgi:hypothetical protein